MPNDCGLENFPRPRGSLSDIGIKANVALFERQAKPGHFANAKEVGLPINQEAKQIIIEAQQQGRVVSKPENPFGQTDSLTLAAVGDLHITGSQPEESAFRRSRLSFIDKSSQERKNVIKPALTVHGFRALTNALIDKLTHRNQGIQAAAIIDIGDRSDTEATMGDVNLTTWEYEKMRQQTEEICREATGNPRLTIQMALMDGNHDADINNKGLEAEAKKRKILGSQVFLQYVGKNYVVLGLNTNLLSRFYYDSLKKRRNEPLFAKVVSQITQELAVQNQLIQKALASGRKIILIGHEDTLLTHALDLKNSRVTHIICGHHHQADNADTKTINKDGEKIRRLRVGATFTGTPGSEKVTGPLGYAIHIIKSEVQVEEIKPKIKDEEALLLEYT